MNYSYETSYPAFKSNQEAKMLQADQVLALIKTGCNNLLQLSEATGLESGRISARVNDLIKDKKVMYSGYITYKDRLRKRIVIVGIGE